MLSLVLRPAVRHSFIDAALPRPCLPVCLLVFVPVSWTTRELILSAFGCAFHDYIALHACVCILASPAVHALDFTFSVCTLGLPEDAFTLMSAASKLRCQPANLIPLHLSFVA